MSITEKYKVSYFTEGKENAFEIDITFNNELYETKFPTIIPDKIFLPNYQLVTYSYDIIEDSNLKNLLNKIESYIKLKEKKPLSNFKLILLKSNK